MRDSEIERQRECDIVQVRCPIQYMRSTGPGVQGNYSVWLDMTGLPSQHRTAVTAQFYEPLKTSENTSWRKLLRICMSECVWMYVCGRVSALTTVNHPIFASLNFRDFSEPANFRWQIFAEHGGHTHTHTVEV